MTKSRRPTIPFAEWKFAVDLAATAEIQNQSGLPASDCNCEVCSEWRKIHRDVLPDTLLTQFDRIGINLKHHTDAYAFMETKTERSIRVIYHFVGKILTGPGNDTYCNKINSNIMNYIPLKSANILSIMVLPADKSFESAPKRADGSHDQVICIDMRLAYALT